MPRTSKYHKRLTATLAARHLIHEASLEAFDKLVERAAEAHAGGDFRQAGRELRAAQMLDDRFAALVTARLRAFYGARTAKKFAAQGTFKVCTKCKKRRRLTSFNRQSTGPTGTIYRRSVCKHCAYDQVKAWRAANPDKQKEIAKRGNVKNQRSIHFKQRFDITAAQFAVLFATCDGLCKICERPETRKDRRLSLDHDHVTGRLRGFVCSNCNMLLGHAKDDPELLKRAAFYLLNADLSHLLSSQDAKSMDGLHG